MLHTWPSYQQAMDTIVLDTSWPRSLHTLGHAGVITTLIAGSDDQVVDAGAYARAGRLATSITRREIPDTAHDLPLTNPRWCAAHLRE